MKYLLRSLSGLVTVGAAHLINQRLMDDVSREDAFARHTSEQHKKHPFSGMHEPFIPTLAQQTFFLEHFPQYNHLLPRSLESFKQQQALETSVKIQSLAYCPIKAEFQQKKKIVVGGPPALISSANEKNITYIYDGQKQPIAYGSAWHLEPDGRTEAPTQHQPSQFLLQQILRVFKYTSLSSAEETGHFPWRSLDLFSWIKHPSSWPEGIRIALAFQRITKTEKDPQKRNNTLEEVAQRCKANERFYHQLDLELNRQLLLNPYGAIIIARNAEEEKSLKELQAGLEEEDRQLKIISSEEMIKRYGFVAKDAVAYGEKSHDRILSPNFIELLAKRVQTLGGEVIQGALTSIYVDNPKEGGIIQLKTLSGKDRYIPFSQLTLSLGNQRILDENNKPLFDIVSARGVSVLALAYVPKNRQLPSSIVCGDTNNVIKLSSPIDLKGSDGRSYDGYLLRMTAGACITPNVSDSDAANYDATAATGVIAAARKALDCEIEILTVYGCNRQVSEYGQSHWLAFSWEKKSNFAFITPRGHHLDVGTHRPKEHPGILIQMGAGGGGLTQAPGRPPDKLKERS